jgi:hypothetical protein
MSSLARSSLITTLQNADLNADSLPDALCDVADQLIEECDIRYLAGVDDYGPVELFLKIVAPRFTECRSLDSSNPVVIYNTEILLLLTMNLKLSLMSRPSRSKSA